MMMPGPPAPAPDKEVRELAQRLVDPGEASALDMLATLTDLMRIALPEYEWRCVAAAREGGITWSGIGAVIGMARQNTQRKFEGIK